MTVNANQQIITGLDVRNYFRDAITDAVSNQNLTFNAETLLYVVNLLTSFMRSENLYEKTGDGYRIRALALIYADSIDAESSVEKNKILQRLGDIALFISGLFSYSLNRSLVDVDYYAALGGNAYANLADATRNNYQGDTLSMVFAELSNKFLSLVDVLAEISENCSRASDSDIMRLYELWLKTGSERAARQLQKNGIQPVPVNSNHH